jgi:hypothetical protein
MDSSGISTKIGALLLSGFKLNKRKFENTFYKMHKQYKLSSSTLHADSVK